MINNQKLIFPSIKERVRGILYGLIAGDMNHGPQAMGILVGRALVENKKNSSSLELKTFHDDEYSREFYQLMVNIFSNYLGWYHGKSKGWYDTGQIGKEIFDSFQVNDFEDKNQSEGYLLKIRKLVKNVDIKLSGQTGGINPAHRNVILSMYNRISDEDLLKFAKEETLLTHQSPFAVEASQMQNYICRRYIRMNISESEPRLSIVQVCKDFINSNPISKEFKHSLSTLLENQEFLKGDSSSVNSLRQNISRGGFSPQTMTAALYFVILHTCILSNEYKSEREMAVSCLLDSFQFAGSPNYCPVLVGPILGSMFGDSIFFNNEESDDNLLGHSARMDEALTLSTELSEMWAEQ